MLELFLGWQQSGAVSVCSIPTSSHHSEVARFGTTLPAQRPKHVRTKPCLVWHAIHLVFLTNKEAPCCYFLLPVYTEVLFEMTSCMHISKYYCITILNNQGDWPECISICVFMICIGITIWYHIEVIILSHSQKESSCFLHSFACSLY